MSDHRESSEPTPYATICRGDPEVGFAGCGRVFMTREHYERQMDMADTTWRCARCGYEAAWDDDNFEEQIEKVEAWFDAAIDYLVERTGAGHERVNQMTKDAEAERAWEQDEPLEWVDEWVRERHLEP